VEISIALDGDGNRSEDRSGRVPRIEHGCLRGTRRSREPVRRVLERTARARLPRQGCDPTPVLESDPSRSV
jgi:hypothetical protein